MPFLNLRQQKFKNPAQVKAFWLSQTPAQRQSFAGLIDCDNRFVEIVPSQTRIGAMGGATLSSAKRWLKNWTHTGHIEKQTRFTHRNTRNRTCRYAVNPLYRSSAVRRLLSEIPEFALVFKMSPIKKQVVAPFYGRIKHNIKVLLSATNQVIKEPSIIDYEYYDPAINSKLLLGISKQLNSAGFEATQVCQVENSQKVAQLPGYDPNMTLEQKKAYVLARSAAIALQKKEQQVTPKQQTMPQGLSSYEQGQWLKAQYSNEQKEAAQRLSRERLESQREYAADFERWREKERRSEYYKQTRIYH